MQGFVLRIAALLELGDPRAHTEQAAFLAYAERTRLPRPRFTARSRAGTLATVAGRFGEAARSIDSAYALGERIGEVDRIPLWLEQRWVLSLTAALCADDVDRTTDDPTRIGDNQSRNANGLGDDADVVLARYAELGGVYPAVPRLVDAARRGDLEAVRGGLDAVWALIESYPRHFHAGPLVALAHAAIAVDDPGLRDGVREVLEPLSGLWAVVAGGGAVYGPYSFWLGRIAAASGDVSTAAKEFTAANGAARRLRATPWATAAERELARLDSGVAPPARSAALRAHSAIQPDHNVFRLDNAVWTLRFAGRTLHLPDAKGLHDLHTLLTHPGQDVAALELLGGVNDITRAAGRLGADTVLDERAKAEYRRRLRRLDEEIDRAVDRADDGRAAAFDTERAALLEELRHAAGLAGRPRRFGDEGERARKTVSARVRDTLRRIDNGHPELAEHLRACVSLGMICRYQPHRDMRWAL